MTTMNRCPACRGYVPSTTPECPHCGLTEPAGPPKSARVPFWLRAAGGGAVAMTMMACYGTIDDDFYDSDYGTTDATVGTSTGTESSTGSETTAAATAMTETSDGSSTSEGGSSGSGTSDTEASTGALDGSTGADGSGGQGGTAGDADGGAAEDGAQDAG